ncbi:hypothetical protein AHAS_Ahas11G0038000 [Arachis hypogaea]
MLSGTVSSRRPLYISFIDSSPAVRLFVAMLGFRSPSSLPTAECKLHQPHRAALLSHRGRSLILLVRRSRRPSLSSPTRASPGPAPQFLPVVHPSCASSVFVASSPSSVTSSPVFVASFPSSVALPQASAHCYCLNA